jgi:hypothetical protein
MSNKITELFEEIKATIEETQGDVEKFTEKGNGSAGTRVRKAMQSLKNLGQEVRKEVSAQKNS